MDVTSERSSTDGTEHCLADLWADLGGSSRHLASVEVTGPTAVLASAFDVTGFAAAAVGTTALALSELAAVRGGATPVAASVDRRRAAASFRFESLLQPVGWELPPVWDPVAGDYRCADGWIRLHTNYRHHRDAAMGVLGCAPERDLVAAAVLGWAGDDLESAVVAAGGCAAFQRSIADWQAHPAGLATAGERPVVIGAPVPFSGGTGPDLRDLAPGEGPLHGVRVLDLTRVIAGPVATRILAGYGAEVLRIDPPSFDEVAVLLPEVTAGKRCAAIDLASPEGRARFAALLAEADVVVGGLRPGALAGVGFGAEEVRAINPAIIDVRHDAYGWSGPWAERRGFDSLVQMSTGIAHAGAVARGVDRPTPLPAQALDHGLGHLLAAATCRALTRRIVDGHASDVRGSLVGVSNVIRSMPDPTGASGLDLGEVGLEAGDTHWGPVRRVPLATSVPGHRPRWDAAAGPLGRHAPTFAPRS